MTRTNPDREAFCAYLCMLYLISPFSWGHQLVLLYPACGLLLRRPNGYWFLLPFILAIYPVMLNMLLDPYTSLYNSIPTLTVVALWWRCLVMHKESCADVTYEQLV